MKHLQPEMAFKDVEVTVVVQQKMPCTNTESRDETVDRRANGYALFAKQPIVLGAVN